MDNLDEVLHQMELFGIVLTDKDRGRIRHLQADRLEGKRFTIGEKSKDWCKLRLFRPRVGGEMIVGRFGTYRHGGSSQRVDVDWRRLSDDERQRMRAERDAKEAAAAAARQAEAEMAALGGLDLWRRASPTGGSPYLQKRGLVGESCRYLGDGTLVVPLLRYDLPRDRALQGVQRILPNGRKLFTKGFAKVGCAVRLGQVTADDRLALVCEGYATGLTLRLAVDQATPVFVALDAGNLAHVVPLLRDLYPGLLVLICADDDWRTTDPQTGQISNPGRTAAKRVAREVARCDFVWPVFDPSTRQDGDTDFDDLRQRQGLDAVRAQIHTVIDAMARLHGA